jgi:hypothetical protein
VILVDTSAWVEFERATESSVDLRLTELIADGGPIATTEPVLMEMLAGARSRRHENELRRLLLSFELLSFDVAVDFEAAASVYRRCRSAGITPRGIVDCMIAAVASRTGACLLAHDRDIVRVARVMELDLDEVSLRDADT